MTAQQAAGRTRRTQRTEGAVSRIEMSEEEARRRRHLVALLETPAARAEAPIPDAPQDSTTHDKEEAVATPAGSSATAH